MDISSSIQAYVNKGVPRKKLGLGIGFYGMCYQLPATDVNQPATNLDSNDNNWNYHYLYTHGYLSNGTYKWVEEAKMGYRSYPGGYSGGDGRRCGMISYEDPASIAAKGAWVKNANTGIGGAIIWTINYGTTNGVDNPLLDAVKRSFLQQ
jgi:chitinase